MPKIVEDALLIYTDGSLYPKGRKGGYGVVFIHVNGIGEETVVSEHAPPGILGTTGNRMELQACIDAMKLGPEMGYFDSVSKIVIRTDSRYVTSNYLTAVGTWRRSRWHNRDGRPVDNADLWKEFARAYGKIRKRVLIEWVKGHGKGVAKDQHNYRADALAKGSAKEPAAARKRLSVIGSQKDRTRVHEARKRATYRANDDHLHHRSTAVASTEKMEVSVSSCVTRQS